LHLSIVLSPYSGLIADKESAMRWRGCRRRPPRRRRGDVARHRLGETEECLTGRAD
jgi:hypothetical protein